MTSRSSIAQELIGDAPYQVEDFLGEDDTPETSDELENEEAEEAKQILSELYVEPGAKLKRGGRPPSMSKKALEQLRLCCVAGLTDEGMAAVLRVSVKTFQNWKKKSPGFRNLLKRAKLLADQKVVVALHERAVGYSHPSEKIFYDKDNSEIIRAPTVQHYPPDTQAARLWLTNRQPGVWRDRQDIQHSGPNGQPLAVNGGVQVLIQQVDAMEASKTYGALMKSLEPMREAPVALSAPSAPTIENDPSDEFL